MSNFIMKLALKQVIPYLSKIGDGIKAIEKDYGVTKARIVIELKVVGGKEVPIIKFEGVNDDYTLKVLKQEPIEKLVDLIVGKNLSEEGEDDE